MGTRHRAGIGITEETDAVTIIVSEENGKVSLGARGKLTTDLDRESLLRNLQQLCLADRKGPASGTDVNPGEA
jgi:diadenylate cyclase